MAHHFESGFMVREPSWHKLERAVLTESPRTWEDARQQAGLTWDVETGDVYRKRVDDIYVDECTHCIPSDQCEECPTTGLEQVVSYDIVKDWKEIRRDDTKSLLSIQPTSYEVVRNEKFGEVIDALLGIEGEEHVEFEALMSLYGGKQVVALARFSTALSFTWDPSETYTYIAFSSRHDGQGGLRGIPTNVRVVCANTLSMAEARDGRRTGFTIKHTANFQDRIDQIRADLVVARGEGDQWTQFAEQLASWKVTKRTTETYLKRFLPVSDDLPPRAAENQLISRQRMRDLLVSPSCEHIADSGYGLLMASTEFADHVRGYRSADSYVARQLLRSEPTKVRAAGILTSMGGIKV